MYLQLAALIWKKAPERQHKRKKEKKDIERRGMSVSWCSITSLRIIILKMKNHPYYFAWEKQDSVNTWERAMGTIQSSTHIRKGKG